MAATIKASIAECSSTIIVYRVSVLHFNLLLEARAGALAGGDSVCRNGALGSTLGILQLHRLSQGNHISLHNGNGYGEVRLTLFSVQNKSEHGVIVGPKEPRECRREGVEASCYLDPAKEGKALMIPKRPTDDLQAGARTFGLWVLGAKWSANKQ